MNMTGYNPTVGGARRWDFLLSLLANYPDPTFVEVGCKEGRTAGHILANHATARVIAIDPWIAMPQMKDVERGETYEKWDFAKIEAEFWKNVGEHSDRCTMLRMTGQEASATVSAPADVVFIDALHDYASVMEDFRTWWPLVKDGGIIATHDFNHGWPTVERAVADTFGLMEVGVGPDSVAFVIKQPGAAIRE